MRTGWLDGDFGMISLSSCFRKEQARWEACGYRCGGRFSYCWRVRHSAQNMPHAGSLREISLNLISSHRRKDPQCLLNLVVFLIQALPIIQLHPIGCQILKILPLHRDTQTNIPSKDKKPAHQGFSIPNPMSGEVDKNIRTYNLAEDQGYR